MTASDIGQLIIAALIAVGCYIPVVVAAHMLTDLLEGVKHDSTAPH